MPRKNKVSSRRRQSRKRDRVKTIREELRGIAVPRHYMRPGRA